MSFLQFLIDDMCANFTVAAISELVKEHLTRGPCTIGDLAHNVAGTDRTLDIKSARILAQAAVDSLAGNGEITVRDTHIALSQPETVA